MGLPEYASNTVYFIAKILKDERIKREMLLAYIILRLKYDFFVKILRRNISHKKILGFDFFFPNHFSWACMFEEVFIESIYFFRTNKKKPFIVDCGSNVGVSLLYFKYLYPEAEILAFEPHKKTMEFLEKNVKRNRLDKVYLHQKALSKSEGNAKFYCDPKNSGPTMMSLDAGRVFKTYEIVETVRLSSYIEKEVDFLKLDIEGAEMEVLKDLVKHKKLKFIKGMAIEYHHHIRPNEDRLSEFLALLEKNRFGYQIKARSPVWAEKEVQDILIYAYRK